MESHFLSLNNENKRDEGQNTGLHSSEGCLCAEHNLSVMLKRKVSLPIRVLTGCLEQQQTELWKKQHVVMSTYCCCCVVSSSAKCCRHVGTLSHTAHITVHWLQHHLTICQHLLQNILLAGTKQCSFDFDHLVTEKTNISFPKGEMKKR